MGRAPEMAYETVDTDTPAARATSLMVAMLALSIVEAFRLSASMNTVHPPTNAVKG
jgi:hypothetical protein